MGQGLCHAACPSSFHGRSWVPYGTQACPSATASCLGVDGAEMYSNTEYDAYQIDPVLATGDEFDCTFPMVIVQARLMQKKLTKKRVFRKIAWAFGKSLLDTEDGTAPPHGLYGEAWEPGSARAKQAGRQFAEGNTFVFAGSMFKASADSS